MDFIGIVFSSFFSSATIYYSLDKSSIQINRTIRHFHQKIYFPLLIHNTILDTSKILFFGSKDEMEEIGTFYIGVLIKSIFSILFSSMLKN